MPHKELGSGGPWDVFKKEGFVIRCRSSKYHSDCSLEIGDSRFKNGVRKQLQ